MEVDARKSDTCVDYMLVGRLFLCMVQRGGEALLRKIRAAGVDVNVADPSGRTLLLHAVDLASTCTKKLRPRIVEAVACLLQNGANANLADDRGQTPLSLVLTAPKRSCLALAGTRGRVHAGHTVTHIESAGEPARNAHRTLRLALQ